MPTPKDAAFARYYAPDRAAWRAWLAEHHATVLGVWLIYYKQGSGKTRVPYPDAVEEALCFGWIDSRPNALDDERFMQLFSPRKPKSPWSRLNKARVERLIVAGQMAPAGLAVVAAKEDGSWGAYDEIETLATPPDVAAALAANANAERYFADFSASAKKQLLWWVVSAKRPETRAKRIAQLVTEAAHNRNPLAYNRRPPALE